MLDTVAPGSTNLFPRECWSLKTLHLKLVFFLAKLVFGKGTAHVLALDKMHSVWHGQAGYKKKDCQTLPRQGKVVLKFFLPLKMVCQLLLP